LEKLYNKNHPNDRQEFSYASNSSGNVNLQSINFFNSNGQKYKDVYYYYYNNEEDKAKINPASIALARGKYLPIFGNFNVNLIKQISESTLTNQISPSTVNREFTYSWVDDIEIVKEKNNIGVISRKRKYGVL
jgi:hypothetical protein